MTDTPALTAGLPVLATRHIGNRTIQFALVIGQPRLRLTFTDYYPPLLGHVSHLDAAHPQLHVSESAHLDWGRTPAHLQRMISDAIFIYYRRERLFAENVLPKTDPGPSEATDAPQ